MKKADRKLQSETLDKAFDRKRPRARVADLEDERLTEVSPPNPTSRGVTPPNPTRPVAPSRDFNKRANSLDKLALPAGIFPGSSKSLYDALYVRTRGAIVPTRTIRATKRELSEWSGVRNVKTIDSHLRYFSAVGLVISEWERGQNDGSLYEVLLPEETRGLFVGSRGVTPPDPPLPHVTPPDATSLQNLGLPHPQNLGLPHLTDPALESTTSETPKTSLIQRPEKLDDEAAAAFTGVIEAFTGAVKDLTGKTPAAADEHRWRELAELLVTELKIAAGRTTVSSVPAFLAEHLRRRLWKVTKGAESGSEGATAPRSPGSMTAPAPAPRDCPDCFGTGMHYPEGFDKGVARCKHEKLTP